MTRVVSRFFRVGRLGALLFGATALGGCSDVHEKDVNPWFRARTSTPRDGGIVNLGPQSRTVFYALVSGRWNRVGEGHNGSVMRLRNDIAVLFSTWDTGTQVLARGEARPRALAEVFQCEGSGSPLLSIRPAGDGVDCGRCGNGAPGGSSCPSVELTRYDIRGVRLSHIVLDRPSDRPECVFRTAGILHYDRRGRPFFAALCERERWGGVHLLSWVKGTEPPVDGHVDSALFDIESTTWGLKVNGFDVLEPRKWVSLVSGRPGDPVPP